MTNYNERLDEILELLHNSWLDDDYDAKDPDATEAKQAIKTIIAKAVVEAYKKGVKDGWEESGEGYNYEYAGLSTIDPDKVGDDIAERLAKQLNTDKELR